MSSPQVKLQNEYGHRNNASGEFLGENCTAALRVTAGDGKIGNKTCHQTMRWLIAHGDLRKHPRKAPKHSRVQFYTWPRATTQIKKNTTCNNQNPT